MKTDRLLGTLMVVLLGATLLFVTYALLARFVLHGEVTAESLGAAVARESPSGGEASCRREEHGRRCTLANSSDTRQYRIRMRDGSCWEARRIVAPNGPPLFDGCVRRWEYGLF